MKKAILIVSIVVLLALLAAPVVGQALFAGDGPDRQMAPRDPGTTRDAEQELERQMDPPPEGYGNASVESPVQIAWRPPPGGYRAP